MAKTKQKPVRAKQKITLKAQSHTPSGKVNHRLWIGLCLLFTLLAFLPVFSAGFVNWDDGDYSYENPLIRSFSNFGKFFTVPVQGNYHPLTMISLALNYAVSGNDAWSYHVLNLLLHLVNTGLAYWLAWRLSGKKFWVALVTGLLFGIHPMRVESVAWVSERKDVLFALFFLLGLLTYLRYLEKPKLKSYLIFTGMFMLSLMSKPAAVTFPVTLLALDYWQKRPLRLNLLVEKIPHFALALLMGYLTVHAQTLKGATDVENLFGFSSRIFFGFYAFMMYWVKLVFPVNLCAFYPFPPINHALPVVYYLSPLFAVAVGAIIYWKRKETKVPVFVMAFFLINIVLVLQFFIVGSAIIADRYTYLPYWAAFFLLGYGAHYAVEVKKRFSKQAALGVTGLVAIVLTALSYFQAQTWKSGEALWDKAIQVAPGSRAYVNRATLHRKKKENDQAFALVNAALVINKMDEQAFLTRGNIYFDRKEYDKAIEDFDRALAINPNNAITYNSRGAVYGSTNQIDKALEDLTKSISLDPNHARSYANRGLLYSNAGRYAESLADYSHYIEMEPKDADVWNSLGFCHENLGNLQKALECYNKAIQLNPKQGVFFRNRSRLHNTLGNTANALSDAQQAQQLGVPMQ